MSKKERSVTVIPKDTMESMGFRLESDNPILGKNHKYFHLDISELDMKINTETTLRDLITKIYKIGYGNGVEKGKSIEQNEIRNFLKSKNIIK